MPADPHWQQTVPCLHFLCGAPELLDGLNTPDHPTTTLPLSETFPQCPYRDTTCNTNSTSTVVFGMHHCSHCTCCQVVQYTTTSSNNTWSLRFSERCNKQAEASGQSSPSEGNTPGLIWIPHYFTVYLCVSYFTYNYKMMYLSSLSWKSIDLPQAEVLPDSKKRKTEVDPFKQRATSDTCPSCMLWSTLTHLYLHVNTTTSCERT